MMGSEHEKELHMLRKSIFQKINESTLEEQNLIQQQNRLLEECK